MDKEVAKTVLTDSILSFTKVNHRFTIADLRNEVLNLAAVEILIIHLRNSKFSTSHQVDSNNRGIIDAFNIAAREMAPDDYNNEHSEFAVDTVNKNVNLANCWNLMRNYFLEFHKYDLNEKYNIFIKKTSLILDSMYFENKLKTDIFNNTGVLKLREHDYNSAIKLFEKALEVFPENDDAYINLALCYLNQNNFAKAIECCKTAIEIDPKVPESYRTIGDVYYKQSKWSEVVRWYRISASLGDESTNKWLVNNGYALT